MELSATEARVLACLVEKEAAVPDSYPLTLNALRLACNQSTNRDPIVAYDDRTVDNALVSLKSMGLVRFMHPAHGGRTIRYRHVADERWRLSPAELGILSVLSCVGRRPSTRSRTRAERTWRCDATVDEVLDALAARSPDPFVVRVERRPGEREPRWAQIISGEVPEGVAEPGRRSPTRHRRPASPVPSEPLPPATSTWPATSPSCGPAWNASNADSAWARTSARADSLALTRSGCPRRSRRRARGRVPGCSCSSAYRWAPDRPGRRGRGANRNAGTALRCAP